MLRLCNESTISLTHSNSLDVSSSHLFPHAPSGGDLLSFAVASMQLATDALAMAGIHMGV